MSALITRIRFHQEKIQKEEEAKKQLSQARVIIEEIQKETAATKSKLLISDYETAKTELNWTADIDLNKGLDETIAWVTNNLNILKEQTMDYVHKA